MHLARNANKREEKQNAEQKTPLIEQLWCFNRTTPLF